MNINNIEEYVNTIDKYSIYDINWNYLKNKAFLITGATGMIGKCLIDILMNKNTKILIVENNENSKYFDEIIMIVKDLTRININALNDTSKWFDNILHKYQYITKISDSKINKLRKLIDAKQ